MAQSFFSTAVTGKSKIDRKLKKLQEKTRKKIMRSSMGKAGTVLKKAIAKRAPVGKTKLLKKSIGASTKAQKNLKTSVDFQGLRVGPNVGKKKSEEDGTNLGASKFAPHAHLVILGTRDRKITGKKRGKDKTKNVGQPTGRVKKNDFVKKAAKSNMRAAIRRLRESALQGIQKEASK